MKPDLNARIQGLLDALVESGEELGLQVAAYVGNELVVDAWAGVADEATGRPVDGETLFPSLSTTKGFAATCLHILADRGRVEYDAPVATYWPEFAAHGKDAVTVRHVLTHMAGIPQMPVGVTPAMTTDWDAMCAAIAKLAPVWTPGTKSGYHAWTFGWIIGELVRRVDGRSIAQFAREELSRPLGIADFYLGIPDSVDGRVASLRETPPTSAADTPSALVRRVYPPQLPFVEIFNRWDVRRASLPALGGIMSARALARHYAMLAGHGMVDGRRILSLERVEIIRSLQTDAVDEVLGWPIRKALGYWLGGEANNGGALAMGTTGGEFGHAAYGGAIGFADPARRLGFGLTKNLLTPWSVTSAAPVVADAIRQYLDACV